MWPWEKLQKWGWIACWISSCNRDGRDGEWSKAVIMWADRPAHHLIIVFTWNHRDSLFKLQAWWWGKVRDGPVNCSCIYSILFYWRILVLPIKQTAAGRAKTDWTQVWWPPIIRHHADDNKQNVVKQWPACCLLIINYKLASSCCLHKQITSSSH
jgi:hypothetical protein